MNSEVQIGVSVKAGKYRFVLKSFRGAYIYPDAPAIFKEANLSDIYSIAVWAQLETVDFTKEALSLSFPLILRSSLIMKGSSSSLLYARSSWALRSWSNSLTRRSPPSFSGAADNS